MLVVAAMRVGSGLALVVGGLGLSAGDVVRAVGDAAPGLVAAVVPKASAVGVLGLGAAVGTSGGAAAWVPVPPAAAAVVGTVEVHL